MPGDTDLKLKRIAVMQADEMKKCVQDNNLIDIKIEMVAYRDLEGVAIGLIIANSQGVQSYTHPVISTAERNQWVKGT